MGIHNSFRNDLHELAHYLDATACYNDDAFKLFKREFLDEVRYIDGHHRCEEEHVFPRLEQLAHTTMNTPLLEGQHHDLLTRTAAVMSILSAKPTTDAEQNKLVGDLKTEYDGWSAVFLNHLRDEEQLTMPIFLSIGRKYWGDSF